jgi:hypothetical protein
MSDYIGVLMGSAISLVIAGYGMSTIVGDQSMVGKMSTKILKIPKKLGRIATKKFSGD